MIPILWPIDLINLPRRGPRPTLKEETRLTLKVMDDLAVPTGEPLQQDPNGLYRRPTTYEPAPAPPAPAPIAMEVPPPVAPPVMAYVPVAPPPPVYYYPVVPAVVPPMYGPGRTVIVMRGGYAYRMRVP
jgi:hypothetical protein